MTKNDAFEDREKAFETKFKLDQETTFKVEARRNKLLGLWLAEKLGIVESEIENYAKEVVLSDLDEPGIEDLVRKVTSDIQTHGADIEENEIREKIRYFENIAIKEITNTD